MIAVTQIKVRSLDVDFTELSWKIDDTTEDVLDYELQVLRSEAPGGPWDAISEKFSDKYLFYDRFTRPFHNWRSLFYIVRVTNKLTGATKDFGPSQQQAEPDLIANELRRHMQLLLREFTGRRCWLLPRRTFGQRCPTCWNKTLQKQTRSGCKTCFDTGFARGFLHPVEVFAQIDTGAPAADVRNAPGGNSARMVDIGGVKPRDILIEAENKRWRVTSVNQTEQSRSPIHLEVQLQEIPESDVEYAIPLVLDQALRDMWISPARNFSNPHNLESYGESADDAIFGLYNTTRQE